jgi:hypothetical protein
VAAEWKKKVDLNAFTSGENPISCILLGNQIDLLPDGKRSKTAEDMQLYVEQHGFIETSMKVGINQSWN